MFSLERPPNLTISLSISISIEPNNDSVLGKPEPIDDDHQSGSHDFADMWSFFENVWKNVSKL